MPHRMFVIEINFYEWIWVFSEKSRLVIPSFLQQFVREWNRALGLMDVMNHE